TAAFAGGPGVGRAGKHGVLGRHPPLSPPLHPARRALLDRGGAEDAGAADLDQTRALGVRYGLALDADRPHLRIRAPAAAVGLHGAHSLRVRVRSIRAVVDRPGSSGASTTRPPAARPSEPPTTSSGA